MPVDVERDHVLGDPDAELTLVEYLDLECPSCGRLLATVDEVRDELGDRLRLVVRHLPIPARHPRAVRAAVATEAAALQGRFEDMVRRLLTHQTAMGEDDLIGHARALDLDVERFAHALEEEIGGRRIEEDVESAIRSGAQRTPTFFAGGTRIDATYSTATLLDALTR